MRPDSISIDTPSTATLRGRRWATTNAHRPEAARIAHTWSAWERSGFDPFTDAGQRELNGYGPLDGAAIVLGMAHPEGEPEDRSELVGWLFDVEHEADVSLEVARDFVEAVTATVLGE